MPYPLGPSCLSLLMLILAGCALPPESRVMPDPPTMPPDSYAPAMWNLKGLEVQPRLSAYRDRLPADSSYEPGTTTWREAPHDVPADLSVIGRRRDDPSSLLRALDRELGLSAGLGRSMWEQTQRIFVTEGSATGLILQWGFQDDAVQGQDYRVEMSEDARGWFIERLETRHHCGRGVSDNGLCL